MNGSTFIVTDENINQLTNKFQYYLTMGLEKISNCPEQIPNLLVLYTNMGKWYYFISSIYALTNENATMKTILASIKLVSPKMKYFYIINIYDLLYILYI